ncbi:PLP-dependent aminotransferase family protein [Peptacetobacter hominis]|uniref:PLP-dependent aminotransferase family protein n=1 Tax=Peptacetobacter hominis TaxID=2743610 RepID=A0A544QTS1_9FIRM|nr:PLP-dependent aminotransferase family protein [Peptacetobacter hominis]TQQ84101.1 PLP-dependent aminotransferase family protein [Peptacetobacter hominis]
MDKYLLNIENTGKSKYLQVYNHIKNMIQNDMIKEGEKLPPIRNLSKKLGINNTTVVKVYELLEKEGYVYKIVGSGTFASRKKRLSISEKNASNTIMFGSGNPSGDMFPVNEFKSAVNMALEKEGSRIFEYDDGMGSINLRTKLLEYLEGLNIKTKVDNIQIISGAQQGIDIVCKGIINYSDVVFVEEPTYSGAIEVFKSRGARIIPIPMLDDGIDIGILKLKLEKIRPKMIYVMPNFQNPTGISYTEYKKKKLIELSEEYDFYILEDDFISDFSFNSQDNRTMRSYDESGRVIYIKSFSKIFMPGLRIGMIDIPSELMDRILWAKYSTDISTPGLIQESLYYYMNNFKWDEHMKSMEHIYNEKYNTAMDSINEYFPGKIKVRKSSGGINFFCELPKGYSSKEFSRYLNNNGIQIIPGYNFFENIIDDRFFRINIAGESVDNIKKGIKLIAEYSDEFLRLKPNENIKESNKIFY